FRDPELGSRRRMAVALRDTSEGLLLSLGQALRRLQGIVKPPDRFRECGNLGIRELARVMRECCNGARDDLAMRDRHTISQPIVPRLFHDAEGIGHRKGRPPARPCRGKGPGHGRVAQGIALRTVTLDPGPVVGLDLHQWRGEPDVHPDETSRRTEPAELRLGSIDQGLLGHSVLSLRRPGPGTDGTTGKLVTRVKDQEIIAVSYVVKSDRTIEPNPQQLANDFMRTEKGPRKQAPGAR